MRFSLFLSALGLLPLSFAQAPVLGQDPPQPGETLGYAFNHACVFSSNLTTTKHFYGSILGMREMFTLETEQLSVMYMGYPCPANQSSAEMTMEQNKKLGLIEFQYLPTRKPKSAEFAELSHLGWVVPDLDKAEQRLMNEGWPILKRKGEDANIHILKAYFGAADVPDEALVLGEMLKGFLLVKDPEGNLLEIHQR